VGVGGSHCGPHPRTLLAEAWGAQHREVNRVRGCLVRRPRTFARVPHVCCGSVHVRRQLLNRADRQGPVRRRRQLAVLAYIPQLPTRSASSVRDPHAHVHVCLQWHTDRDAPVCQSTRASVSSTYVGEQVADGETVTPAVFKGQARGAAQGKHERKCLVKPPVERRRPRSHTYSPLSLFSVLRSHCPSCDKPRRTMQETRGQGGIWERGGWRLVRGGVVEAHQEQGIVNSLQEGPQA
jgi:hypothetical protein